MKFYVVYDVNEDRTHMWVDSYWLNYDNAVARFKELWKQIASREPDLCEIASRVKAVVTED